MTSHTFLGAGAFLATNEPPLRCSEYQTRSRTKRKAIRLLLGDAPTRLGLDERDIMILGANGSFAIGNEVSSARLPDAAGAALPEDVSGMLLETAANVARHHMLALAGYGPDDEAPAWSIALSAVFAAMIRADRHTPSNFWNAGINIYDGEIERPVVCSDQQRYHARDPRHALAAGCDCIRYRSGMFLEWNLAGARYYEFGGAFLQLPCSRIGGGDGTDVIGCLIGDVVAGDDALVAALKAYRITAAEPLYTGSDMLHLALDVAMTTMEPIPEALLDQAGIKPATQDDAARPWWIRTDPARLLAFNP